MYTVALIGTHGTGKTTVYNELRTCIPEGAFFTEGVRHQMPSFGYKDPYQLIKAFGAGAFELVNINSWSVIDPAVNQLLDSVPIVVTDRSAVDNYAYYLTLAKGEDDLRYQPLIRQMATHYASLVDQFIYFPPTDAVPLVGDAMRLVGLDYQKAVDQNIHKAIDALNIIPSRVHTLGAVAIEDRVTEVLSVIASTFTD